MEPTNVNYDPAATRTMGLAFTRAALTLPTTTTTLLPPRTMGLAFKCEDNPAYRYISDETQCAEAVADLHPDTVTYNGGWLGNRNQRPGCIKRDGEARFNTYNDGVNRACNYYSVQGCYCVLVS